MKIVREHIRFEKTKSEKDFRDKLIPKKIKVLKKGWSPQRDDDYYELEIIENKESLYLRYNPEENFFISYDISIIIDLEDGNVPYKRKSEKKCFDYIIVDGKYVDWEEIKKPIRENIRFEQPESEKEFKDSLFEIPDWYFIKNPHYADILKLLKRGYDIVFSFNNDTMKKIYKELNYLIMPFLQNTVIYNLNHRYMNIKDLKKEYTYIMNHKCTIGRYDINNSILWNMNDNEKIIAKSLYKGKNNEEFPFFLKDGTQLAFIISKSGKYVTLVIEGDISNKIKKYFKKVPGYNDYYLKDGWKKPEEIIDFVKKISK